MAVNMTVARSLARLKTEEELQALVAEAQAAVVANKGNIVSASTGGGASYSRQGMQAAEDMLELYEAALALKQGRDPEEDMDDVSQIARPHFVNFR